MMLAAWVLLRFPPETSAFYPVCPIFRLTGLLCPGCGSTRALAALLHGQVREAIHWNALFVLLLPLGLAYLAVVMWRLMVGNPDRWPRMPEVAVKLLCGLALGFAALRNVA
jgi:hypothetical protein